LRTISSGALLIAVSPEKTEKMLVALKNEGVRAAMIGKVVNKKEGMHIIRKSGTKLDLSKPMKEELWKALKK
jgi:hydrogenase maturation factor